MGLEPGIGLSPSLGVFLRPGATGGVGHNNISFARRTLTRGLLLRSKRGPKYKNAGPVLPGVPWCPSWGWGGGGQVRDGGGVRWTVSRGRHRW